MVAELIEASPFVAVLIVESTARDVAVDKMAGDKMAVEMAVDKMDNVGWD